MLPLLYIKPDSLFILYTDTTAKQERNLSRIISEKNLVHEEINKLKITPYGLEENITKLKSLFLNKKEDELIFNITGGTKIMSIALFEIAQQMKSDIVYLQSEGSQSILYRYTYKETGYSEEKITLGELIDLDLYLTSHIGYYGKRERVDGVGGLFEKAISDALKQNGFEVLESIEPHKEGKQLEIDLVLRLKGTNNVAIAEVKGGDKSEEGPKKGIEQLALAGQRDYLGIYTKRFLIISRRLSKPIRELAQAHKIIIIDEIETERSGLVLTEKSKNKLLQAIKEKLNN